MSRFLRAAPASRTRAAVAAIACPTAATLVALPLRDFGTVTSASLYLLAVVAAASLGGIWSGLGAALLSFLGLNYLFTPPLHTFRIAKVEDLVALLMFLAVASIVGLLLAKAIEERTRATRREQETRLLNQFSTTLLKQEPLDRLLRELARVLLVPFALVRSEIHVERDPTLDVAVEMPRGDGGGVPVTVPVTVRGEPAGSIVVVRGATAGPLEGPDLALIESCARQIAIAIERERLDAQVREARLSSETNELRAALFSSVTHDLRTPLASIKAGATSLLDPAATHDAEQQRELLETIAQETDRLNRLLGNILDLAKIRAGALSPTKAPTSIEDVIESVLHRLSSELQHVRVRTVIRPELPDVLMDPMQIDQVMTNVLENAARFSPAGAEITVAASLWHASIQVRIVDQGPGVPADERDRVFEPFFRRDADGRTAGSGLGLAIARAIVLAHGGRIWIEGAPGGGTAIVFELPTRDVVPSPQEPS